jgi:hypothetical protein
MWQLQSAFAVIKDTKLHRKICRTSVGPRGHAWAQSRGSTAVPTRCATRLQSEPDPRPAHVWVKHFASLELLERARVGRAWAAGASGCRARRRPRPPAFRRSSGCAVLHPPPRRSTNTRLPIYHGHQHTPPCFRDLLHKTLPEPALRCVGPASESAMHPAIIIARAAGGRAPTAAGRCVARGAAAPAVAAPSPGPNGRLARVPCTSTVGLDAAPRVA